MAKGNMFIKMVPITKDNGLTVKRMVRGGSVIQMVQFMRDHGMMT